MIYRSKSRRMDCSFNWSYISYGELLCDAVMMALKTMNFKLPIVFLRITWVFGLERSSLGYNFWVRLTALRLFCYCHYVIRQDHGFGSHLNLVSYRVGFMLRCFYKSNSSYLFCPSYLFCKLWLRRVLIAADAFLTDVDRLPWKSQSEFLRYENNA